MKVTTQNSIVDKFECKLTNRSLKCQSVLGLVWIRKTAKQLAPHQLTNLFLKLNLVKANNKNTEPMMVLGQIYVQNRVEN